MLIFDFGLKGNFLLFFIFFIWNLKFDFDFIKIFIWKDKIFLLILLNFLFYFILFTYCKEEVFFCLLIKFKKNYQNSQKIGDIN